MLSRELSLSADELESIMRLIQSELDVSLPRLLVAESSADEGTG